MAHQSYRGNLASAMFPFATQLWGRSIIVPQYDQNFDRTVNVGSDPDKDKGIPQAFYMHNCMPTAQGYQAIGFDTAITAVLGAPTDFDAAFPFQNSTLNRFLFSPSVGKNYIFDAVVASWASVSPIPPGTFPDNILVTTAFIHAQTYLFYAGYGGFTYNSGTKALDVVAFTGLTIANIKGICAAQGYMIAWTDSAVAWSSLVTETDFIPSIITGAGGGAVNEAKGKIIVCLPIAGGFLVYCERNIVSAKYSGNVRFPFIFNEVAGSGGLVSPEQVSWQANLPYHYAWTTAGLQKVDKSTAENIFPEATDFLAAKIFEDFDEGTLLFSIQYLTSPLSLKLTVVGDRFAVLSYGIATPDFTHALVFDLSLRRWGKIKITHRDCFQWNAPNLYGMLTYGQLGSLTYGDLGSTTYGELNTSVRNAEFVKHTMAFLQQDGTVKLVNFDLAQTADDGVLLLGKFQFQRNNFIVHQWTDVENVIDGNNFNFYLLSTLDGKTFQPAVAGTLIRNSGLSKRYGKRVTGQNISHLYIGAFNLTTFITDFTQGGQR